MRTRLLFSVLFLTVLITDQVSKLAVNTAFNVHDSRQIIGNLLRLTYIRNKGAAFGLKLGDPKIMFIITVLVTLFFLYLFLSGKINPGNVFGKCALVMIIGGAIGNLIDRIRMGEVIDFIDMGIGNHRWPVYNLADVYITVGMFILIFFNVFSQKRSEAQ